MVTVEFDADEGFFGPGSVAWQLHSCPSSLIGGIRALLVQALNPLAMAGVDQHSDFRSDTWGRFERTVGFINTITFGTQSEAEKAIDAVGRVHQKVRGIDPVTGRSYRADDPELLLWVHNVMVHSFILAKRRFGGGLVELDANRYLCEMALIAEMLGVRYDDVPTTTTDLALYLADQDLVVSPLAHEIKWGILTAPVPLRFRPAWALVGAAGLSLLPAPARDLYGVGWLMPSAPLIRIAARSACGALEKWGPTPPARREAEKRIGLSKNARRPAVARS